ncbi:MULTISPECIES: hypothetical protein [Pseudomonas]|uniref:hypothetical protein n=1 Tax=Pseudomonas TaxID=286 RepID=UPI0039902BE8
MHDRFEPSGLGNARRVFRDVVHQPAAPLHGGSVVNTFMAEDLGWDKQTLGLLTALNILAGALAGGVALASLALTGSRPSRCTSRLPRAWYR